MPFRNRGWFLVFTLSVAINCSITIFFAIYCINVEVMPILYQMFIFWDVHTTISMQYTYCINAFRVGSFSTSSVLLKRSSSVVLDGFSQDSLWVDSNISRRCWFLIKSWDGFFFSCCMRQWTWLPTRCSTTSGTTTWRTREVNITTRSAAACATTWPSTSPASLLPSRNMRASGICELRRLGRSNKVDL